MAKISIKPSQARNAVQQEAALASRLQSLESQVRSIRNGLRYKIAAREHIKSQLKAAEDQIRLERTRVTGMRNTLEQVINLYTRTENSATGSLKPKKPASGDDGRILPGLFPNGLFPGRFPGGLFPWPNPNYPIYPRVLPSFQDYLQERLRRQWLEHLTPDLRKNISDILGPAIPIAIPIVAPVGPGGIWGRLNKVEDFFKDGLEAKAETGTSGSLFNEHAVIGNKEKGAYAEADVSLGKYEASAEAKAHAGKDGVYATASAAAGGTAAVFSNGFGYHSDNVNADVSAEASLLHADASVNAKAQMIDGDGNFNPQLSAGAEGSAYVARAEGQASVSVLDEFGINHEYNAEGKATVLGAEGKAKANLSFTNDKGEFEPQAEASAEGSAYIVKASGSVEAKNDFGGIKVTGNAEVGVEGSIGFKTEDGKLTVKAGLTVFGGGEVELTVDYRKIGEKTAQAAKSTFEWIDSKMPWNW